MTSPVHLVFREDAGIWLNLLIVEVFTVFGPSIYLVGFFFFLLFFTTITYTVTLPFEPVFLGCLHQPDLIFDESVSTYS